jgi:hypothetical protein
MPVAAVRESGSGPSATSLDVRFFGRYWGAGYRGKADEAQTGLNRRS